VADVTEALSLTRAGKIAEALSAAEAEILADPMDIESHELIIDILMNLGLGFQAQDRYADLASARGEAPWAWTLAGQAETTAVGARQAFDRALRADPGYARAQAGIGDVDRAEGSLDDAERRYKAALAQDPTLAGVYAALGGMLLAQARNAEALAVCHDAMLHAPGDPEAYLGASQLDPKGAKSYLRKGHRNVPDDPRLLAALGEVLLSEGDLAGAAKAFTKSLAIDPHQPDLVVAEILLEEVAAGVLKPEVRAALQRARALIETAPLAAVDEMNRLAARYPNSFLVHLSRGHVLAETRDLAGAELSLRRALLLRPNHPEAQATLGLLLLTRGQVAEAWPLLDSARTQRPRDVSVAISAAMARAQVQGPSAAAQDLALTADRFPMDPRPVMALATLLSQIGDAQAAYTVLARAVDRFPHPSLLLAAAGAAQDIGDKAAAARHLRTLSEITGEARWNNAANELSGN
jgi:tetratricopeptide (TPR) repeat protein